MKKLNVCGGQRQVARADGHGPFILNLKATCVWFVDVTHSLSTPNGKQHPVQPITKDLACKASFKNTLWIFLFLKMVFGEPSSKDLWNIKI